MSIESILKKLEGMDGFEESDIEELKALGKPKDKDGKVERDLKEAKAAQARILEEKKALQAKAAELESTLEELKTGGLTEVERAQKELDKNTKAYEKLQAEMLALQAASAAKDRSHRIDQISSSLTFIDTVPKDMRTYAVANAFKDVEDLDDPTQVDNVLENFRESHKGVLASDTAARGSGSIPRNQEPASNNTKSADKMSPSERAKHIREKVRDVNSL